MRYVTHTIFPGLTDDKKQETQSISMNERRGGKMEKRTVLVTGANGYIGRHVVKALLDMGNRVIADDLVLDSIDDRAEKISVPIFSGDENIYEQLGSPDVVIHMAWRNGFVHNAD